MITTQQFDVGGGAVHVWLRGPGLKWAPEERHQSWCLQAKHFIGFPFDLKEEVLRPNWDYNSNVTSYVFKNNKDLGFVGASHKRKKTTSKWTHRGYINAEISLKLYGMWRCDMVYTCIYNSTYTWYNTAGHLVVQKTIPWITVFTSTSQGVVKDRL